MLRDMPVPDAATPANEAISEFIAHLADRGFAASTRRTRRHFLSEYLSHAQQAAEKTRMTAGELMDAAKCESWLADAAAGKTRTRNTIRGPQAAAYPNSMRVRIDTWNSFAEFLGLAGRRETERPAPGFALTPEDTERLLHDLSVRRPVYASAMTALRTAAVAALVADTGQGVPELASLKVGALHLDADEPHVDIADGDPVPLSNATVSILSRWLSARAALIAELQGSDPGHLWIPTKPGRPRGGRAPVKPGIEPAAVRTLHHAHRVLVSQLLGTPLRPGALRELSKEAGVSAAKPARSLCRTDRGDCHGRVVLGEPAARGVDGLTETGQKLPQPVRRDAVHAAHGRHHVQPLLAGIGLVPFQPPRLRLTEPACPRYPVSRLGTHREVAAGPYLLLGLVHVPEQRDPTTRAPPRAGGAAPSRPWRLRRLARPGAIPGRRRPRRTACPRDPSPRRRATMPVPQPMSRISRPGLRSMIRSMSSAG